MTTVITACVVILTLLALCWSWAWLMPEDQGESRSERRARRAVPIDITQYVSGMPPTDEDRPKGPPLPERRRFEYHMLDPALTDELQITEYLNREAKEGWRVIDIHRHGAGSMYWVLLERPYLAERAGAFPLDTVRDL